MQGNWIVPEWPALPHIKALTTLRGEGFDLSVLREGADREAVIENRRQLYQHAALPTRPVWLNQVHGGHVVELYHEAGDRETLAPLADSLIADASITFEKGVVCAVLTADCLPILLSSNTGSCVGAIHAGWRGLNAGIIEATLDGLSARGQRPEGMIAWLGPAIGPTAFEVGEEVMAHLRPDGVPLGDKAVHRSHPQEKKWYLNLYELARERLQQKGVQWIFGGGFCTYKEWPRFFSFRRNSNEGRMASLIWLE